MRESAMRGEEEQRGQVERNLTPGMHPTRNRATLNIYVSSGRVMPGVRRWLKVAYACRIKL